MFQSSTHSLPFKRNINFFLLYVSPKLYFHGNSFFLATKQIRFSFYFFIHTKRLDKIVWISMQCVRNDVKRINLRATHLMVIILTTIQFWARNQNSIFTINAKKKQICFFSLSSGSFPLDLVSQVFSSSLISGIRSRSLSHHRSHTALIIITN